MSNIRNVEYIGRQREWMLFDQGMSYEESHANVFNKMNIYFLNSKLRFAQSCQLLANDEDIIYMLSLCDSFARVYIATTTHKALNETSL